MGFHVDDTIVAVASARGGAMRGIVRISGQDAAVCLRKRFRPDEPIARDDIRRPLVIPGEFSLAAPFRQASCDLYLWPTQRSYTGQPCAEIHTIGSLPLLDSVVESLCSAGARLAEPGEFTLRAFLAGRLDLTQAEAVLGVIDSRSRAELDVSLSQLAGGLRAPLDRLRDELLDLLAHLEAGLDFVEEDVEYITTEQLLIALLRASCEIGRLADQMQMRSEREEEFRVVLVGSPSVGKSSLLNALAGHSAALVSDKAATTRDYLACRLELDGCPCLLVDTAGIQLDQQADALAMASQAMTSRQYRQAHLHLLCLDATRPLNDWERVQLASQSPIDRLVVLTKTDAKLATDFVGHAVQTSSKTGAGLDELRSEVVRMIGQSTFGQADVVPSTGIRCRDSLRLAAEDLRRAHDLAAHQLGEELIAAELRGALEEVGKVVGAVYTDDILDRVFSRFCIGK